MRINIELWRVRIGAFNPGIKNRLKFHGICLSKGTFSVAVRLVLCLCILLIIGGVEQNPGPPKGLPIRGGFMPNIPNTRSRALSQSTLGVSESGDLGIARRQSFTDKVPV